ncbi:MAG: flagellar basal body P-ring formation protein FlgA [Ideonella sp.]|nr:flagellar basal body P-ring formation protein FlgA [Ideonella sp.]
MRSMNTKVCGLLVGALCAGAALAQVGTAPGPGNGTSPLDAALTHQLQQLARESASTAWSSHSAPARVEVEVGQLDARLTLAPCARVEPYLPAGVRLAGRTRIGLRCTQGQTRWNVYLPLTVKIFARSLVASTALPAGTVLRVHHLAQAEVDLAASPDPAIAQADLALGRTLARPLSAGDALRQGDLKLRSWFAAGDLVRVVAVGPGFAVSAEGQALGPGVEGQAARVRTESGRIVTGMPTGDRRIEVPL